MPTRTTLTNDQVITAGPANTSPAALAYVAMIATMPHDEWCEAYGLDVDAQNGGTYWADVVRQAVMYGDVDAETGELT